MEPKQMQMDDGYVVMLPKNYALQNRRNYPSPQHILAHRRGHTPKIVLTNGSRAILSAILETPENDQC
jgi:hypothetical protein